MSPRLRSRSPPLSYPPKRIKLGNHSIVGHPRSPSPPRRGRLPPSRPRSLRESPSRPSPYKSPARSPAPKIKDDEPPEPGLIIEDEPPPPPPRRRAPTPTRPRTPPVIKAEPRIVKVEPLVPVKHEAEVKVSPIIEDLQPVKEELKEVTAPAPAAHTSPVDEKPDVQMRDPSPPRHPAAYRPPVDEKPDVQMRNASPPRHPRNRGGGAPARGTMYHRRGSRSPPRGPRGDRERFPPRGRGGRRGLPSQAASFSNAGPSTYPSGPSTYPSGSGPSTYPPSAAPPTPTTPVTEPLPPPRALAPVPEPEVLPLPKLPPIPAWDLRDPERAELAVAQNTSRQHRAVLRTQYVGLEKVTRRALQELETANLELRAVEGRRKVADQHLEKARAGALGIEYIPPLVDIVHAA
ncbi:hypothetical protein C8R47DRAFT_1071800 [Mycena vitilis]|nr:hypothetical protein C8R47DRAFT_1071800 [Mycena vitilis]